MLRAVVTHAGGGGVTAGLVDAGIGHVDAIECDPRNMDLSLQMAEVYENNFKNMMPSSRLHLSSVEEFNWDKINARPFIMQSSPVCANFSVAGSGIEDKSDYSQAEAIARGISILQPNYFILENVPAYLNSESFKVICKALRENHYAMIAEFINFQDYGLPQSRKRLIVLCSKSHLKPILFPAMTSQMGWGDVVEWGNIKEYKPTVKQEKVLDSHKFANHMVSVLVQRYGQVYPEKLKVVEHTKPCWTLTKYTFCDGKGGGRKMAIGGYDRLLGWFYLPFGEIQKIAGFPKWYKLPEDKPGVSGAILGYAVPSSFIKLLIKSNFVI